MRTTVRVLVDGIHLSHRAKGVGLYTRNVLERLAALDSDLHITLVLLANKPPPELTLRHEPRLVPWRNHLWHGFHTLPQVARRTRPDVVWMPYDTPVAFLGAPFLMVCHDIPEELQRAQEDGGERRSPLVRLRDRFALRLWASALRRATRVLCNSRYVANRLVTGYRVDGERVELAPCAPGVDFEALSRRVEVEEVRRRLQAPHGYLLSFYTGDSRENPRAIPPVFNRLVEAGVRHRLVVAGLRSAERAEMEALYRPYRWFDRVSFLPFFNDARRFELAQLYTAATVYLDPSLQEGFGMQVIEAMACGTPVVCSDRGALPEVTDGAALLVEPHAVEATAQTLLELLIDEDLQHSLARLGRQRARQFDWQQTAETIHRGILDAARLGDGDAV